MSEQEAMLVAVGVEVNDDSDNPEQFPVHVRMDDEAVYVDIHIGDKVYGTLIPWMGIVALSHAIDNQQYELPPLLGTPPAKGKELMN